MLQHVITQIGLESIQLYSPADFVHNHLRKQKEITRLNQLRHLGRLPHAQHGVRQARWDYTVTLIYYINKLCLPGMQGNFRIDSVEFSSALAALQCIALVWNTGHVPGTFSVEKGIYRFLYERNSEEPATILSWPHNLIPDVQRMQKEANRLLHQEDYLGIARVLGVIKLLSISSGPGDRFFEFVRCFFAPFLLQYDERYSRQWPKLRKAFETVRHLAYLTLDTPFSGLQWAPSIPALVDHQIQRVQNFDQFTALDQFAGTISEILSPLEKLTYDSIYHCDEAREKSSVIAEHVYRHLDNQANPSAVIADWLTHGLYNRLKLGQSPSTKHVNRVASTRLRSRYAVLPYTIIDLEESLREKRFSHPAIFQYKMWNLDAMVESDELIIDVVVDSPPTINHVGRFIVWFISQFEDFDIRPNDPDYALDIFRKGELEDTYSSLLKRAIEMAYPNIDVRLVPWNLTRFGLLNNSPPMESRGGIWASSARLNNSVTNYLLRDRRSRVQPDLRDQYEELMGIRELRRELRKRWKQKELRQRWLVVTGSVRLCQGSKDLIEFDGGLIKISTRSGEMTWYGMEVKRRRKDPLHSLNKKLEALGIGANTYSLGSRYAFVELPLQVHDTEA